MNPAVLDERCTRIKIGDLVARLMKSPSLDRLPTGAPLTASRPWVVLTPRYHSVPLLRPDIAYQHLKDVPDIPAMPQTKPKDIQRLS
jgi:hypothetical protein